MTICRHAPRALMDNLRADASQSKRAIRFFRENPRPSATKIICGCARCKAYYGATIVVKNCSFDYRLPRVL